jgi:hypothetical protein
LWQLDVLNRGYSGYTTMRIMPYLANVFPESLQQPELVTVFFGANDASSLEVFVSQSEKETSKL